MISFNNTDTYTNLSTSTNSQFTNEYTTENGFQKEEIESINSARATVGIFCDIIMCLGLIENVMVVLVILKTKNMRNSMNFFLLNLSIADLIDILVRIIMELEENFIDPNSWMRGKEMCFIKRIFWMMATHASVYTMLAVSFERYYVICHPFKAGYVCTNRRAVIICALVWFFAVISASFLFGQITFTEDVNRPTFYLCNTPARPFWHKIFVILINIINFFIPFIVLIILYSIIAKSLIKNNEFVAQNSSNTRNGSNILKYRKVTLMLGAVILSFFVCFLPIKVIEVSIVIDAKKTVNLFGRERYLKIVYFAEVMMYLHPEINPILYSLFSSKFRKGLVKLLRINKLRCKSRRSVEQILLQQMSYN